MWRETMWSLEDSRDRVSPRDSTFMLFRGARRLSILGCTQFLPAVGLKCDVQFDVKFDVKCGLKCGLFPPAPLMIDTDND